ncbi:MAG: hypothetical protein RLZ98_645 [Pseudomonadota bacterium]
MSKATAKGTILVAGGGIGGLSAALALGRRGWTVRVLEREPQFGAIGYGIQLGPNVFPMFDRLGVTQAVLGKSIKPGNLWMYDAMDGEPVLRIPTGAGFEKRFGAPYIVIHRVDLHNILMAACAEVEEIHLDENADIVRYEDSGAAVRVLTRDGRSFEGEALIAADGLRSTVREQMVGTSEPDLIGYVAHRVVVPISEAPAGIPLGDVILWGGPGFHIVNYPLRGGEVFNIVAVFRTDTFSERGTVDDYRRELQETYRDAHPIMRQMIDMVNLERRWPIGDRLPRRGWSSGRVVMLGDAAHAALQSLAQGACMAIEDAVILGALIDVCDGDFAAAFERFERERLLRTARVQLEGRYMWNIFYHTGGIEAQVRNSIQRARDEDDVYRCLDWLYAPQAVPVSLQS